MATRKCECQPNWLLEDCAIDGYIYSPGYPRNYDAKLKLSWHIKLPLGQQIEIFLWDLDVQDRWMCW